MSIPFVQFCLPDGRRKDMPLDVPPDIQRLADALIELGAKFEMEVLTTGHVHADVSIETEDDEGVLANVVHANGPGLPEAIHDMVREAAKEKGLGS